MNRSMLIIAVSSTGYELACELQNRIKAYESGDDDLKFDTIAIGVKSKHVEKQATMKETLKDTLKKEMIEGSLASFVEENFSKYDVILFISATGIAVRMISKCLEHKAKDPAVLVMDETGRFCISLLSGHLGGANEYANKIAHFIGATPVITTATDCHGIFAVDQFAKKNHLRISDLKLCKDISSALLEGDEVDIYVNQNIAIHQQNKDCSFPNGLHQILSLEERKNKYCIYIGDCIRDYDSEIKETMRNEKDMLYLFSKNLIVGVGCKKETEKDVIKIAVEQCLRENNYSMTDVYALASIDLKKDEKGLLEYCRENKFFFETFSANELNEISESESKSEFVKSITGVDNVCEKAALCLGKRMLLESHAALNQMKLVVKKTIYHHVTVAVVKLNEEIRF